MSVPCPSVCSSVVSNRRVGSIGIGGVAIVHGFRSLQVLGWEGERCWHGARGHCGDQGDGGDEEEYLKNAKLIIRCVYEWQAK